MGFFDIFQYREILNTDKGWKQNLDLESAPYRKQPYESVVKLRQILHLGQILQFGQIFKFWLSLFVVTLDN